METRTDKDSDLRLPRWVVTVIGILVFLLAVQTGAVFYHLTAGKSKTESTEPASRLMLRAERAPQPSAVAAFHGAGAPQTLYGNSRWDDPFAEDPFAALDRMQARMNRLMSRFASAAPLMMGPSSSFDFAPTLDFEDRQDHYLARLDLPGLDKDKIDVTVRGTLLTIRGVRETASEKQDSSTGFYARERSYGSFARSLTLPGPVDEAGVTAEYEDGVLTIRLPKTASDQDSGKVTVS